MVFIIFGLILFVIGLITSIICLDEGDGFVGVMTFFILLICLTPLFLGISVYPYLAGKKAEALSLRDDIVTIKDAYYPSVSSGDLIGGSLDNMQQSQEVSKYIKTYALKKAEYNSALVSAKIRKEITLYKWFADAMFIDKRIHELEKL